MAEIVVPKRELFINGEWIPTLKGGRMDVIDPATEEVIGTIPSATAEDVDKAVHFASIAFRDGRWSRCAGSYRAQYLRAISEKIKERKEYLAKLETADCGKPIDEALWDMDDVASCFAYYADLAEEMDREPFKNVDVGMEDFKVKVRRDPLGVVALITPWNYPMLMSAWKVAPALAAGCTCVLKPSELASVTSLELAAIASEVGLPEGVLNVITGTGTDAGAPLSSHPLIAKVAFTGSPFTGRRVATAAANNLRPCSLELGGKSAVIVFADTDLDKAVEWIMFGTFWNGGQVCSSTSRLLLERSIKDEFLAKLKRRAESILACDPQVPGCRLGPLVSKGQYDKVVSYIKAGLEDGAELLTGGARPPILDPKSTLPFPDCIAASAGDRSPAIRHSGRGYYVAPTVLLVDGSTGSCSGPSFGSKSGCRPGPDPRRNRAWREEIFGPVLSVATFTSEAEAVALANDSEFGLAGAVLTDNDARRQRVVDALECGIAWSNCTQVCFHQAPWGGVKDSGYGRELGTWGLSNYLAEKQVTEYVSKEAWGWYLPSKL